MKSYEDELRRKYRNAVAKELFEDLKDMTIEERERFMVSYKEIDCRHCDNLELHKEIDDGVWKCMRCGNKE